MSDEKGLFRFKRKIRRAIFLAAASTTAATATGVTTFYMWGPTAQMWEGLTALALGAASAKMLTSKGSHENMAPAGGIIAAMGATAFTEATVAGWDGGGQQSLVAWLLGGAVFGSLGWIWERHDMYTRLEWKHRDVKIRNERYLGKANIESKEMALELKRLQMELKMAQLKPNESEPLFTSGVIGTIQRVVWRKHGAIIEPIMVMTGAGWVAETPLTGELTLNHMTKLLPELEAALDLPGDLKVTSGQTGGQINIVYSEPLDMPDKAPYEPFEVRAWDDPVVLGIDGRANLVDVDLNLHAAIAGATGQGKSTLVNCIILQLAERECVKVGGIDMKPFAPEFSPLRPILDDLVTDLVKAHEKLDWFIAEMYRRGKIMQENKWKKWRPTEDDPIYYLFVDEYAEAIRQDKSSAGKRKVKTGLSIQDKVETILAMSRAYGLILVLCTQQPSAKLFGDDTAARGNLPIRISFTMTESNHDRYVLPTSGGWNTIMLGGYPGRFLMFSPKHRVPEPFLSFMVEDDMLETEVERISLLLGERYPEILDLTKEDKSAPDLEEMPSAVLVQLALGPATRRELAEHFGVAADDWRLKKALAGLSQDKEIYADDRHVWHLVVD